MGRLEDAANNLLKERTKEEALRQAQEQESRRREEERNELIAEFINLMQTKGISPEVLYRETFNSPPRGTRGVVSADYSPAGVTGWVVTNRSPGEYDMCDARGLVLTPDGEIWKYEAKKPHSVSSSSPVRLSAFFQVYRYSGHGSFLKFTNQRAERYEIQAKDLTESAATYLQSL